MRMMFPVLKPKETTNYSTKYFSELGCTFHGTQAILTKQYRTKKAQPNLTPIQKDIIEDSYSNLIDPKSKDKYIKYLLWNFIFSQPNNIESLKRNFHSYVSPNFIFSLIGEKPTIPRYLRIDFLKYELCIFDKGDNLLCIDIEDIETLTKQENGILIGLKKDKKHKIVFSPSIPTQTELIYILIMYMAYYKEAQTSIADDPDQFSNNPKEEKRKPLIDSLVQTEEYINIKELIMIQNDFYLPSGIVLRAKVLIEKKKRNADHDRYLVLGNALIGIFKDETMTKLLQVIPLIPLYVFFTFNYEKAKMKIGILNQDLAIYFDCSDEMQIWQAMLYNIADGKVEVKIKDETLTGLLVHSPLNSFNGGLNGFSPINRLESQINELENQLKLLKIKKEEISKYIQKDKRE